MKYLIASFFAAFSFFIAFGQYLPIAGGTVTGNLSVNGTLGVGTSSPQSTLNVKDGVSDFRFSTGASALTPTMSVINSNSSGKAGALVAGTTGAAFAFDNSGIFLILGESKSAFTGNSVGVGNYYVRMHGDGKFGIGTNYTPTQLFDVNGQFVVNGSNGNVGIGTSNPVGKLQVDVNNEDLDNDEGSYTGLILNNTNHNAQTAVTYTLDGRVMSKLRSDYEGNLNLVAYSGNHNFFTGGDFGSGHIRMVLGNNGNIALGGDITNGNTGTGSKLFINSSGNVGIGTITPGSYKLAVNGDFVAKKVRVTQDPNFWPDYVFDPSYKLPTLKSIEAFINLHKHLSDVPSAKQVKDKGIDLGDNQAALLKKIEELTLYVIDLNKKVQKLTSDNAKQERTLLKLLSDKH